MSQGKPSKEELKQKRRERAEIWRLFRADNMLTQERLAHNVGISRRTIQLIENGHITPQAETLRRFASFKRKYDVNQDLHSDM